MPRRVFVELLAVVVAFALGAAGARYSAPYRVEQTTSTVERVRLKEVLKATAQTDVTRDEHRNGSFTGTRTTTRRQDGTTVVVEQGSIVWNDRMQLAASQKLTLELQRDASRDVRTETKTITLAAPALSVGIGVGGPFGIVPLHFDLSVALFAMYRVGELFKVPISVWGVLSLQPPTFVPNAGFIGIAVSL